MDTQKDIINSLLYKALMETDLFIDKNGIYPDGYGFSFYRLKLKGNNNFHVGFYTWNLSSGFFAWEEFIGMGHRDYPVEEYDDIKFEEVFERCSDDLKEKMIWHLNILNTSYDVFDLEKML